MGLTRVKIKDLDRFHRQLKERFRPAVRRGLEIGGQRCVAILQRETKKKGAVNYGTYRQAWDTHPTTKGQRVYNPMAYAGVIEEGRRPGQMPPREAIARWAQRKLHLSREEAKAAAFPIARAIAKRGLKGRHVLRGAIEKLTKAMTDEVVRTLRETLGGAA